MIERLELRNLTVFTGLKQELPVGKASRRWVQALATSCHVVNLDKWNENFPKWPVTRLAVAAPEEPK
ncbi:MAG: phage hypothetical protein [Bacteroidetes bacterium HLUCCA01]|nr:MAG: phage hypothetical protein [Bacteroidetes bacterium HLUCCA01]